MQISRRVFGSRLGCSRVVSGMNGLDAPGPKQKGASGSSSGPCHKRVINSERCWIKLANQVAAHAPFQKVPTQAPQKARETVILSRNCGRGNDHTMKKEKKAQIKVRGNIAMA